MSITEQRQRGRALTPSFHRSRRSAPLSSYTQTRSVASATTCIDPILQSSNGTFDAKTRERLVFAEDGVLGGSAQTRAVHVMVPREEVQAVVADVDLGARITLVPVPGGAAVAAS